MSKGILYGVGVGPGNPDYVTLAAIKAVQACPVVASPRTRDGAMVALDIMRGAVELLDKEILPLDFSMSRDAAVRQESHRQAATLLAQRLDSGLSVAMLNLGDVSLYASFQYMAGILGPQGYEIKMIPGITSFCAAASALGVSLTEMDKPLHIIPGGVGIAPGQPGLDGSRVWMKSAGALPQLLQGLADTGRLQNAMLAQNVGLAGEALYPTLEDAVPESKYFSIVIERG